VLKFLSDEIGEHDDMQWVMLYDPRTLTAADGPTVKVVAVTRYTKFTALGEYCGHYMYSFYVNLLLRESKYFTKILDKRPSLVLSVLRELVKHAKTLYLSAETVKFLERLGK
jgi:hypothetical protein